MAVELAKLGHVALVTPDLERSFWFFHDVMGLDEVERRDGVVYLRAWGEFEHHSLSLREGPTAVDHIGLRAKRPDDVELLAGELERSGIEVTRVEDGVEAGQGAAIRFLSPSGHPLEVYYDIAKPKAPEEIRSRLKSNNASAWRRGLSPRRIDHVNLTTTDVESGQAWLCEQLGFRLREYLRPANRPMAAAFLAVTSQVHDVALARDLGGGEGRFHHLAYWFDSLGDVMRAADIVKEHGDLTIDLGPGMHGVSRGFYCYLKDPGSGHRVELFSGGYHIFDPDWEPLEWTSAEFVEANSWWGPHYRPTGDHPMDTTTPCIVAPEGAGTFAEAGAQA